MKGQVKMKAKNRPRRNGDTVLWTRSLNLAIREIEIRDGSCW